MNRFASFVDALNAKVGELTKWLCTVLVLLICLDVVFRYLFDNSKVWILELEWHLFSLIFLFGAGYTFLKDEHVRVDVFYSNWSEKKKARVDLLGTVFFLIPWCLVIIYYGYQYGINSWSFNEGSPNPGGLPARYFIKFCIAIAFFLLLLQGIARIIKSIQVIRT